MDKNILSNRFASDWIVLHLFSSIYWLTERHTSQYAFLTSGGMKFAEQLAKLTSEEISAAARLQHVRGGRIHGLRNLASDQEFPHNLSAAMNALQMGHADVMGTDGHRRLCRYEGNAYMTLFGEPLVFCTPNLADTKQPLLLVVQGVEIRLEDSSIMSQGDLPKYRDMMKRLARNPVGQTLVFDKMMKLFFIHVLGVRPDLMENRRRVKPSADQKWCTDGVAASSFGPGIFGPVRAFRGEIEAQGRGSLHPHILVWLLCMRPADVLRLLQRNPGSLQTRLGTWMKQCVSSMQSTCQSSVKRAPQRFGHLDQVADPLPFSKTERGLTRYDGGSEIDAMRDELQQSGVEPTDEQNWLCEDEAEKAAWSRPELPLKDKSVTQWAAAGDGKPKPGSTYAKVISEFAVFRCPDHRRRGTLHQRSDLSADEQSADSWEKVFTEDVRSLAEEILVHVCGESCFKYSGVKVQRICRHGYYYIISLA